MVVWYVCTRFPGADATRLMSVAIPTASIDEESEGRSLMPDGLIDELSEQDLVDLVRFLSELGKGEFAIGNQPVVRKWEALLPTKDAPPCCS